MNDKLLEKISVLTDEERNILSGIAFDKKLYSTEEDFIVNDKRLTSGKRDIFIRTHPRYSPFPSHKHTFAEIMIVFSGKITHIISDKRITLSEGDILLLNKHVTHSIEMTDTADVGINVIISDKFADIISPRLDGTLFSSFFKENAKRDGSESYMCFRAKGVLEIENLTENLISEFTREAPDETIIKDTLSLLLYYLSKNRNSLLAEENLKGDRDTLRKLEISSYIKNNYRTATLCELAERLYITPPHLSKLVVKYFGKSFKELLLEERILQATELFRESNISIGTIIRNMGYENESYFHREYKKRVGMTPLAVRKSAKIAKFTQKRADLT